MLTSSKVLRSFDEQTSRRCSGAIAPAFNAHHLEFDVNSPTSRYKLTVPADGHYAIFLQHMPEEFGDGEFLQSTNGDHVEAEATEKAGEEAKPAKGSQVGIVILAVCVCTLLATIIPLVVALSVKNPTTLKPLISRFNATAGVTAHRLGPDRAAPDQGQPTKARVSRAELWSPAGQFLRGHKVAALTG